MALGIKSGPFSPRPEIDEITIAEALGTEGAELRTPRAKRLSRQENAERRARNRRKALRLFNRPAEEEAARIRAIIRQLGQTIPAGRAATIATSGRGVLSRATTTGQVATA